MMEEEEEEEEQQEEEDEVRESLRLSTRGHCFLLLVSTCLGVA